MYILFLKTLNMVARLRHIHTINVLLSTGFWCCYGRGLHDPEQQHSYSQWLGEFKQQNASMVWCVLLSCLQNSDNMQLRFLCVHFELFNGSFHRKVLDLALVHLSRSNNIKQKDKYQGIHVMS